MSRSKRKTPIFGYTTATSEKIDKRLANRAYRHKVKLAIKGGSDLFPVQQEVSNVWSFGKDGKRYVSVHSWGHEMMKKAMRK